MKLIFLNGTPLANIFGKKVDPHWFLKNGYKVEFWNLDLIYYNQKQLNAYFSNDKNFRCKVPNEKKFSYKKDVKKELSKLSKNVTFCFLDFGNHNDFWLRRYLKIFNFNYYVGPRSVGYHSRKYFNRSLYNKLKFIIYSIYESLKNNVFIERLFFKRRVLMVIYKYTNYYKKPEFVASSGKIGRVAWMDRTLSKEFLSIPSIDILWQPSKKIINNNYAVFVDDTIFHSPDIALNIDISNSVRTKDLNQYKKNLINVFDFLEKEEGLKIVIAASGKYLYHDENPYGGREIIYNKTNELLQYSSFALGHNSSGLNQALLNNQPIVMMIDNTFEDEKKYMINQVARFLMINPINISSLNYDSLKILVHKKLNNKKIIENYFYEGVNNDSYVDSNTLISEKIKRMQKNI